MECTWPTLPLSMLRGREAVPDRHSAQRVYVLKKLSIKAVIDSQKLKGHMFVSCTVHIFQLFCFGSIWMRGDLLNSISEFQVEKNQLFLSFISLLSIPSWSQPFGHKKRERNIVSYDLTAFHFCPKLQRKNEEKHTSFYVLFLILLLTAATELTTNLTSVLHKKKLLHLSFPQPTGTKLWLH